MLDSDTIRIHYGPPEYQKPKLPQIVFNKIRYHAVIQAFRNRLAALSVEITPFYLTKENLNNIIIPPEIEGNSEDYHLEFLNAQDLKMIDEYFSGYPLEVSLRRLEKGNKCIGIKQEEMLVAFVWFDLNECSFEPYRFKLNNNEAYYYSLYTIESYRGRNIAPYLVYKCFEMLKNHGKETFYSIAEYFNHPAIKYKRKLNSMNVLLILYIRLLKKFSWRITLKKYM